MPGQATAPWVTEGTGFLYGYLTVHDPDPTKRKYEVYLVTNRHVIEQHGAAAPGPRPDTIGVRLNPIDSSTPARPFDLPIGDRPGENSWFFHPSGDLDIAAIGLNHQFLKDQGLQNVFFANDQLTANRSSLKQLDVSVGDGVFVLGFPALTLVGAPRNYVIARQGCIARISDMLDNVSREYLIDVLVFPGNSGSPVLLKPEFTSIQGTKGQPNAHLIGIVRAYVPYREVAISPQTREPRVLFVQNSGLAEVLPTDYIDEAIKAWRETKLSPQ